MKKVDRVDDSMLGKKFLFDLNFNKKIEGVLVRDHECYYFLNNIQIGSDPQNDIQKNYPEYAYSYRIAGGEPMVRHQAENFILLENNFETINDYEI